MTASLLLIAWFLVGGALAAAAAEIVCRAVLRARHRRFVYIPRWRVQVELNPDYHPALNGTVMFETNRFGQRGDDPPAGDGIFRVLASGGSAVECFLLDGPRSWPAVLESVLSEREACALLHARCVHVANIGRSGIDTEKLAEVFESGTFPADRYDIVLIMTGAADVLRWLAAGAAADPPVPQPSLDEVFHWRSDSLYGWRPSSAASVKVAKMLVRAFVRPVETRRDGGGWMIAARASRVATTSFIEDVPDPAPMYRHYEEALGRAIRAAARRADRVLVVEQAWFDRNPTPEEALQLWNPALGAPWKDGGKAFYSHDLAMRLMRGLTDATRRTAEACGVEFMDLRPHVPGNRETFYDMFHYTNEGAAIVGRAVADRILEISSRYESASRVDERA